MEELAIWVTVLTPLGAIVGWLLRKLLKRWRNHLSTEEMELLKAAATTGDIYVLKVDGHGEWVEAGTIHFARNDDPAYAARYIDALHQLMRRGYARAEGGILYRLTGVGFEAARRISNPNLRTSLYENK